MYGPHGGQFMRATKLSNIELKQQWQELWGRVIPPKFGQAMLEKSIAYKADQIAGKGLNEADQKQLDRLVKDYKRNPQCFDQPQQKAVGTRLVRKWQGTEHEVTITEDGYQYKGIHCYSLSKIAFDITGTRWNGLVFFGLKQRTKTKAKA